MSNSRNLTKSESEFRDEISELINSSPKNLIASAPPLFTNRVPVQSLIRSFVTPLLLLYILFVFNELLYKPQYPILYVAST